MLLFNGRFLLILHHFSCLTSFHISGKNFPKLATYDGNVHIETLQGKEVYISRLRRATGSITNIADRIKIVENVVAEESDKATFQYGTAFGVAASTLAKTFTSAARALTAAVEEVAVAKDQFDSTQADFDQSVNEALQQAIDEAAAKADADGKDLQKSFDDVKKDVTAGIDDVKDAATAAGKCAADGLAWNGEKCIAQNFVVAVNDDLKCTEQNAGQVRFNKEDKALEACDGADWASISGGNSKKCDKAYGSDPCNPAVGCNALGRMFGKNGA